MGLVETNPAPPDPKPEIVLSALARIVNPWPTSPRSWWTVARVQSALQLQSMGAFSHVAQLWDAMREDDEIPGALATRVSATVGAEFSLDLEDDLKGSSPQVDALADDWTDIAPDEAVSDLLSDYLMLGAGVGTLDWDLSAEPWTPRLRPLPAEFLEYDTHERCWYYLTRAEGRVRVTPGDGKWVILSAGERPWLKGYVRALADIWRSKRLTLADWQRYCQKHGLPLLRAKMPIYRDAAEKQDFIDRLAALQSEGVIGLPQDDAGNGYEVDLLEATTVSWQTFEANLRRADRKIQITLLGGNAPVETVGSTGNNNTAEEQSKGLITRAVRDSRALSQCLRDQLVRPYALLNWGADAPVPVPNYNVDQETVSGAELYENQGRFSRMLESMRRAGFVLTNLNEAAEALGLVLEEAPLPEAAPASDAPEAPAEGA